MIASNSSSSATLDCGSAPSPTRRHLWARRALPVIGPAFLVVCGAVLLLWTFALHAPHETDLFWQIPEGLQILHGHLPASVPYAIEAGRWVDHEWLFELIGAWLWSHGAFSVFVVLCAAAYAAFPAFVYALLRRVGYADAVAGIVALLAAAGEKVGFALRAQTFSYYWMTAELWLLWTGLRRPWLLLPLGAIWANTHASAVLAPLLCLIFFFGCLLQRQFATARRALAGAVFSSLGTLCTPSGLALWTYAGLKLAPANAAIASIQEWRPLGLTDGFTWIVVAPVAAALIAALMHFRRDRAIEVLLAAVFLVLAVKQMRQIAFLVPAASILLARTLASVGAIRWIELREYRLSAAVLVPFLAVAAWGASSVASAAVDPPGPWRDAAAIVREHAVHGNVFAAYEWAAYLHFKNLPVRVLIDAHGDPYSAAVWRDCMTITRKQPGWLSALRRNGIRSVLVETSSPLAHALTKTPGWHVIAKRGVVTGFAANAAVTAPSVLSLAR